MRKKLTIALSIVGLLLTAAAPSTFAADAKTITLTGEGMCAKCKLKEADKCQNVIQAKEEGKTVNYYLVQNKIAKDFHSNVCTKTQKITAKGTVKEVDGKKQFTATEIEVAK